MEPEDLQIAFSVALAHVSLNLHESAWYYQKVYRLA